MLLIGLVTILNWVLATLALVFNIPWLCLVGPATLYPLYYFSSEEEIVRWVEFSGQPWFALTMVLLSATYLVGMVVIFGFWIALSVMVISYVLMMPGQKIARRAVYNALDNKED
jgi:membrane-associated phospholipid phosphatase